MAIIIQCRDRQLGGHKLNCKFLSSYVVAPVPLSLRPPSAPSTRQIKYEWGLLISKYDEHTSGPHPSQRGSGRTASESKVYAN